MRGFEIMMLRTCL